MTVQDIIDELNQGKTVAILSDDAFEFMREVERCDIPCKEITLRFTGEGQCVLAIENRSSPVVKNGHIVRGDCDAGYACDDPAQDNSVLRVASDSAAALDKWAGMTTDGEQYESR